MSSVTWDLDRMVEVIEIELKVGERAIFSLPRKTGSGRPLPTAASFMTPTHLSCVYCGQRHTSNSCSVVSSAESKKQSLRRSGQCFTCLRRNHIIRNCHSSTRCIHCHGKHHDSICVHLPLQDMSGGSKSTVNTSSGTYTPIMYVNSQTPVLL